MTSSAVHKPTSTPIQLFLILEQTSEHGQSPLPSINEKYTRLNRMIPPFMPYVETFL